jgi:hypothetical protein
LAIFLAQQRNSSARPVQRALRPVRPLAHHPFGKKYSTAAISGERLRIAGLAAPSKVKSTCVETGLLPDNL